MKLKCININPLPGNEIAPPLKLGELYSLVQVQLDSKGNRHLDVGIRCKETFAKPAYIRSYETKEELDEGDKIWWCHPSRFEIIHETITPFKATE